MIDTEIILNINQIAAILSRKDTAIPQTSFFQLFSLRIKNDKLLI
jgi:hypothetical protein